MIRFMDTVSKAIEGMFGDGMTDAMRFRVTTELMPLYKQLCTLKILEFGLRLAPSMNVYRNPIYKEIRCAIADIGAFWRKSGLMLLPGYLPNLDMRLFFRGGSENDKLQVDVNLAALLHARRDAVIGEIETIDKLLCEGGAVSNGSNDDDGDPLFHEKLMKGKGMG